MAARGGLAVVAERVHVARCNEMKREAQVKPVCFPFFMWRKGVRQAFFRPCGGAGKPLFPGRNVAGDLSDLQRGGVFSVRQRSV